MRQNAVNDIRLPCLPVAFPLSRQHGAWIEIHCLPVALFAAARRLFTVCSQPPKAADGPLFYPSMQPPICAATIGQDYPRRSRFISFRRAEGASRLTAGQYPRKFLRAPIRRCHAHFGLLTPAQNHDIRGLEAPKTSFSECFINRSPDVVGPCASLR